MDIPNVLSRQQYRKELCQLALPISLQCLLQSSFSVVDQVMIGQLGSVSIAAVGLAGKFVALLTVMVQAIATVCGIILAQAVGKGEKEEISKGFFTNLMLALLLAAGFTTFGLMIPERIMGIYSKDRDTILTAASYLRIYSVSFLPLALTSLMSAFLRCMKDTKTPLYAGIGAALGNTLLNYLLIYGKLGFPEMGVQGAAWASVLSQIAGCLIIALVFWMGYGRTNILTVSVYRDKTERSAYLKILLPLFICEFLWVLGENVYGYLYGHMGTQACAAMTLINPVMSLMIGALSGVGQAAGIMEGQLLGAGNEDGAYLTAKWLMKTGLVGSVLLSAVLLVISPAYVQIFNVEASVRAMTQGILIAFALICPVKVGNMILGGGIIRSGGKTQYVMLIDMTGTWLFGVPLGFLSAFVWKLPIAWVYFILSLEEVVRLGISFVVFHKKKWMQQL